MSRLAIRYQLRNQGSQLTMEDFQIIDNKRTRLQKLIDMFDHQADASLFNHEPTEDVPISSLGDYAEYDNVDDLDDSGMPQSLNLAHSSSIHSHRTHTADGSGPIVEDIPLLLPSSLGWKWCIQRGHKSLANKEAKLRYSQATDALHRIRLALGFKSALFRTQVRHSRTQRTKSRAWTAVHSIDLSVHEHARNYGMARDAYAKVLDPSMDLAELPALQLTDLRVSTAILGAAEVGQRNQQLPWLWSFGTSTKQDGTWMDDCECLHISEGIITTYGWNS